MSQIRKQLGIDRLSATERIELIGEIWDSLTETGEELPLPEWHRPEVERRRAAAEANPGAGIPWEVVKAHPVDRSWDETGTIASEPIKKKAPAPPSAHPDAVGALDSSRKPALGA